MVRTEQLLGVATQTTAINNIKPVRTFLTRLLMQTEEVLHTEHVELSTMEGGAETAPFVRKNARSIMVPGDQYTFATVETPNIRISRPIEPGRLLDDRRPEMPIMASQDEVMSGAEAYIAQTQRRLRERIDNTIELLVSQLLQGQISYQVDEGANFTITLPRLSSHNIDLVSGKHWDNPTQTDVYVSEDFDTAKQLASEEGGVITHALLGANAATWFIRNAKVRAELNRDSGVIVGNDFDLRRQYQRDGAIYLGSLMGIECWSYARKLMVNGVATDLIRPDFVEFVSATPETEATMYWGKILDMDAYEAREHIGRFYSKAWTEKDPSHLKLLAHSRPLPWFKQPNFNISMDVLA